MSKENSFIQLIKDTVVEVIDKKYESAEDLDDRVNAIENELEEKDIFNTNIENRMHILENELEEIENDLDNKVDTSIKNSKYFKIKKGETKIVTIINVPESIKNIKNSLDDIEGTWNSDKRMSRSVWSILEEKTLKKEIEYAITAIVANHGRTEKAIKARLVKIGALDY